MRIFNLFNVIEILYAVFFFQCFFITDSLFVINEDTYICLLSLYSLMSHVSIEKKFCTIYLFLKDYKQSN